MRIEAKKQLHDCVPYFITYYLEDDTISVKERKQRDESYDICPFLIKRVKVPKYAKRLINSLIVAEDDGIADSNNEQHEYVQPGDFSVGKEVNLLGHRFLIRDCDAKTRKYYEEVLKINQNDRVNVDTIRPSKMQEVMISTFYSFGVIQIDSFEFPAHTKVHWIRNTRRFAGIVQKFGSTRATKESHSIHSQCK